MRQFLAQDSRVFSYDKGVAHALIQMANGGMAIQYCWGVPLRREASFNSNAEAVQYANFRNSMEK